MTSKVLDNVFLKCQISWSFLLLRVVKMTIDTILTLFGLLEIVADILFVLVRIGNDDTSLVVLGNLEDYIGIPGPMLHEVLIYVHLYIPLLGFRVAELAFDTLGTLLVFTMFETNLGLVQIWIFNKHFLRSQARCGL